MKRNKSKKKEKFQWQQGDIASVRNPNEGVAEEEEELDRYRNPRTRFTRQSGGEVCAALVKRVSQWNVGRCCGTEGDASYGEP